MFVHLQNFQHVSDQSTNPLIWFPSKFLSLSSTLLTRCYVCSLRWSDCTLIYFHLSSLPISSRGTFCSFKTSASCFHPVGAGVETRLRTIVHVISVKHFTSGYQ